MIATRFFPHTQGVLGGKNIAVSDDGNLHRPFDPSDGGPIGASRIHLCTGAGMQADGRRPRILTHAGKLLANIGIKSETELHRQRSASRRMHRGADHLGSQGRIFHQGASVPVFNNLRHGTSHIQVDPCGTVSQGMDHAVGHNFGFRAEQLDPAGLFLWPEGEKISRFFIFIPNTLGADHFGANPVGAVGTANLPKGTVGHARKRRKKHLARLCKIHDSKSFILVFVPSLYHRMKQKSSKFAENRKG